VEATVTDYIDKQALMCVLNKERYCEKETGLFLLGLRNRIKAGEFDAKPATFPHGCLSCAHKDDCAGRPCTGYERIPDFPCRFCGKCGSVCTPPKSPPIMCTGFSKPHFGRRVDALEKRANSLDCERKRQAQDIDILSKKVERLEKEQADQKEAYPFISVNVPGYAKPMIVRTDSWNKE
jgi:hypothetical protein